MSYTAYPLSWPLGKPRSRSRQPARFENTFAQAREGLRNELRLMGATGVVLSCNVELRPDGLPYSRRQQPTDVGFAVYFTWKESQYAFACDCWSKVEHNLQAIRKTIEAVRGIARWGTGEMVASAFAGFKALPEVAGPSNGSTWWEILGVSSEASATVIEATYKAKAKLAHPDRPGGSVELFLQLTEARKQGLHARTAQ